MVEVSTSILSMKEGEEVETIIGLERAKTICWVKGEKWVMKIVYFARS